MRSEGFRNLICAVLLSLAVATVLTGCINADPNSRSPDFSLTNTPSASRGMAVRTSRRPASWHPNNTTLLVPLDSEVRVQFQFRNDPARFWSRRFVVK
jgi:hypothetical protein